MTIPRTYKMGQLLVAVDGSVPALNALQYAVSLLQAHPDGMIHLVNIQPLILPLGEYPDFDTLEKAQRHYAQNIVRQARQGLAGTHVMVTTHVEIGPVAEGIIQYAQAHNIDQIVMGTRGMGVLGNLVLGSVANRVVHLAHVPVTLVK